MAKVTCNLRYHAHNASAHNDFQHGYQIWTWFVNFLDKKSKN